MSRENVEFIEAIYGGTEGLEKEALLGVHPRCFPWRNAEELRVKAVDPLEEAAPAGLGLARLARFRICSPEVQIGDDENTTHAQCSRGDSSARSGPASTPPAPRAPQTPPTSSSPASKAKHL